MKVVIGQRMEKVRFWFRYLPGCFCTKCGRGYADEDAITKCGKDDWILPRPRLQALHPVRTVCYIERENGTIFKGYADRHRRDQFTKAVGRKLSLTRAMRHAYPMSRGPDRQDRAQFWVQVLNSSLGIKK